MRDIYVYCAFFLNFPNAHIIAGSQLRHRFTPWESAIRDGSLQSCSRPRRGRGQFHRRMRSPAPHRVSHTCCRTLLHFLRYSVERESRSTCASQIAKLSSISGFIIGNGKVYSVCTRARMRDREQSAWKVTLWRVKLQWRWGSLSLSFSLARAYARYGEIPTQRKWLTRFLVRCVVTPISPSYKRDVNYFILTIGKSNDLPCLLGEAT